MWIFAIDAGTLTWEILAEIRRNEQHYLPDLSKQTARSLEGKNPRAGVSAGSMAGGTTDSNRGIIPMELVYKNAKVTRVAIAARQKNYTVKTLTSRL